MINDTLTLLKKARELISAPNHWTTEFNAKNAAGYPVASIDETAVCFCSIGALLHYVRNGNHLFISANEKLRDSMNKMSSGLTFVWQYNDSHTHSEVLALWDKTIQRLENEHAITT